MYCILVAGPPASGKSTLAARLSARLGLPMASKDELKEVLFDTLGFSSRQEKVALGVAAMALLCAFAQAQMRVGKSFILENNFEDVAKPPLQALLARYGYTPITLRMAGDPAVLYRRFLARNASPERHRGLSLIHILCGAIACRSAVVLRRARLGRRGRLMGFCVALGRGQRLH